MNNKEYEKLQKWQKDFFLNNLIWPKWTKTIFVTTNVFRNARRGRLYSLAYKENDIEEVMRLLKSGYLNPTISVEWIDSVEEWPLIQLDELQWDHFL